MSWQPTEAELALLRHVIDLFGPKHQTLKAVEEYAEATAVIARFTNGNPALESMAEELADAEIMLAQLRLICPKLETAMSTIRARKLSLLATRSGFPEAL